MIRRASPPLLAALLFVQGCALPRLAPMPVEEPLPPLQVEQITPPPAPVSPEAELFPSVPELQGHGAGPPITLSASNADVRALIPAIAETMGISVVIGPEVEGRMTVSLEDIPALVALRAILNEAGLTLMGSAGREPLWDPVVFYTLPVNITDASVELVQARFGVSRIAAETAKAVPFADQPR